jgi:hypothetical protein
MYYLTIKLSCSLLVCACLKRREATIRLDSIHCPILEYDILRNALEVDIIEFKTRHDMTR